MSANPNLMADVKLTEVKVEPVKAKTYHMGVVYGSNCPLQNVHVGGIDFPLYTEQVERVAGESGTTRSRVKGVIRSLTEPQVARIMERVATKVFRGRRLMSTKNRYYVPSAEDKPLARYLYLKEVEAEDTIHIEKVQRQDAKAAAREAEVRATDADDENRRKRASLAKLTETKLPPTM